MRSDTMANVRLVMRLLAAMPCLTEVALRLRGIFNRVDPIVDPSSYRQYYRESVRLRQLVRQLGFHFRLLSATTTWPHVKSLLLEGPNCWYFGEITKFCPRLQFVKVDIGRCAGELDKTMRAFDWFSGLESLHTLVLDKPTRPLSATGTWSNRVPGDTVDTIQGTATSSSRLSAHDSNEK